MFYCTAENRKCVHLFATLYDFQAWPDVSSSCGCETSDRLKSNGVFQKLAPGGTTSRVFVFVIIKAPAKVQRMTEYA
jgi:hypothetical protein